MIGGACVRRALCAAIALATLLAAGACASGRGSGDWTYDPTVGNRPGPGVGSGRTPEEALPIVPDTIPPLGPASRLREFTVDDPSRNRYAIDPASLAVDDDVVVRYALLVTSPSGARNVTYEAIQCNLGARRLIAVGQPDGRWVRVRAPAWEPVRRRGGFDVHDELARALCEGRVAVRKRDEMVRRLVQGPTLPNY